MYGEEIEDCINKPSNVDLPENKGNDSNALDVPY